MKKEIVISKCALAIAVLGFGFAAYKWYDNKCEKAKKRVQAMMEAQQREHEEAKRQRELRERMLRAQEEAECEAELKRLEREAAARAEKEAAKRRHAEEAARIREEVRVAIEAKKASLEKIEVDTGLNCPYAGKYLCVIPLSKKVAEYLEVTAIEGELVAFKKYDFKEGLRTITSKEFEQLIEGRAYLLATDKTAWLFPKAEDPIPSKIVDKDFVYNPAKEDFGVMYDYLETYMIKPKKSFRFLVYFEAKDGGEALWRVLGDYGDFFRIEEIRRKIRATMPKGNDKVSIERNNEEIERLIRTGRICYSRPGETRKIRRIKR